jgi:hypothetical protein
MTNEELKNEARAALYRKPAPPTEEQKVKQRWWNSRVHAKPMGLLNEMMGNLGQVNERLKQFGVDPAVFDALNADELSDPDLGNKLTRRIAQLRGVLSERCSLLAEYEEDAAADELARERAAETPLERKVREQGEEIAQLKAGRHQEAPPRQRDIQPAREAPPMPFTTPNLLSAPGSYGCAPADAPPVTPHYGRGAAVVQRRGDGVQASGPAMPNVDTLTVRSSTPAELNRALLRDFVR